MSRRRSRYTPPATPAAPAVERPWVHHYSLEDVVTVAVAYRSRFVSRKHYGVCFDAGFRALQAKHPEMPEHDARVVTSRIITAVTNEHSDFFNYHREAGEELWPAGWYVDDVMVDEADQEAKAAELRQLIQDRKGYA